MGATSHDVTAKERRLDERYFLTTPKGIALFIEEIPKLRCLAEHGYYEAINLLVDFERAIEEAALSERQLQVMKLHLIHGYTQEEVAERLGISRQRVAEIVMLASGRIAQIYNAWALAGEGYGL